MSLNLDRIIRKPIIDSSDIKMLQEASSSLRLVVRTGVREEI